MGAFVALRVGPWVVLAAAVGTCVLIYVVGTLIVWRDRQAELRRRAAGEPPSWSAQLPLAVARQFGGVVPGRHVRANAPQTGELLGRLCYPGDRLRWEPSASLRAKAPNR